MAEVQKMLQRWHASFCKATDFDSWGQLVEAVDEYHILARHLQKEAQSQTNSNEFTEDQKRTIGKMATCLELRSAALQSSQSQEDFKLEDLKKLEPIIKNILTYNKEFPFDVQPVPLRKILAPGEEENLEFEEEEDGVAGAGSPDSFPPRVPGTLLPRLPSEPGMTLLTIRIEKIGLKDAGQCIDPYITVSVKDLNGIDLTPVQDTPVASRKEDTYVHFNVDIEIQKHVEKLTKGLIFRTYDSGGKRGPVIALNLIKICTVINLFCAEDVYIRPKSSKYSTNFNGICHYIMKPNGSS